MRPQLELVADCPACRVEGALTELYDPAAPASAFGLPAESRCRVCEASWRSDVSEVPAAQGDRSYAAGRCPRCDAALGDDALRERACARCGARATLERVEPGHDLGDLEALRARIEALAREDDSTPAEYLDANLLGVGVEALREKIARGERVESTYESAHALFQRGVGRAVNVSARQAQLARPLAQHAPRAGARATEAGDSRAILLALVSVLVADGQTDPRETAFIDRFLRREGMAPLRPEEWVVHRPVEIAGRIPPARRGEVVELMTQLACVDGELDASELRVVESYAAAWQIPPEEIEGWTERYRHQYTNDLRRFLRRLRSFFLRPRDPR